MSNLDKLLDGVEVEWKTLGELTNVLRGRRLTREQLSSDKKFPVFHGGLEPLGYYEQKNRPANSVMIINVGASAGTVGYSDVDFWSSDGCYSIEHSEKLSNKFLYYFLIGEQHFLQSRVRKAGIPTLDAPVIEKLQIPIPPLSVQKEIVRILDTFTELTAELTAELSARKKQYSYYRETLLSFEDGEVEWKTLGDIYKFQYGTGNTIPTTGGEYPVYGSNGIVGSHSEYNSEDSPVIGHIGAYAGIVNFGKGKHFVTYNGVICKLISEKVNPRYGYHQLLKQDFNSLAKNSSQPFVSYKELNSVKIPIPPLEEQSRIVSILDKFDTLTTSISEGLPKEIELRKKQYEYYRDLLLTFPKKETA